jgi:hypothetical protein
MEKSGNLHVALERHSRIARAKGLDVNKAMEFRTIGAPVLEERPWAVYSACKEADPEIFFAATRADERAAVAVCTTCSVADQCLEFAIETRERFGVWGGTNERQRRKMLRT